MNFKSQTSLAVRGESLATEYLLSKEFRILHRNYHSPYGEIDIIAMSQGELVICEVKTRNSHSIKSIENSITISKQKKITRTALHFLSKNPYLSNISCRFDVILIIHHLKDDTYQVLHYPDAFKPIILESDY
jgi:putative endonuclease